MMCGGDFLLPLLPVGQGHVYPVWLWPYLFITGNPNWGTDWMVVRFQDLENIVQGSNSLKYCGAAHLPGLSVILGVITIGFGFAFLVVVAIKVLGAGGRSLR
jgi:hypothetical protein